MLRTVYRMSSRSTVPAPSARWCRRIRRSRNWRWQLASRARSAAATSIFDCARRIFAMPASARAFRGSGCRSPTSMRSTVRSSSAASFARIIRCWRSGCGRRRKKALKYRRSMRWTTIGCYALRTRRSWHRPCGLPSSRRSSSPPHEARAGRYPRRSRRSQRRRRQRRSQRASCRDPGAPCSSATPQSSMPTRRKSPHWRRCCAKSLAQRSGC